MAGGESNKAGEVAALTISCQTRRGRNGLGEAWE